MMDKKNMENVTDNIKENIDTDHDIAVNIHVGRKKTPIPPNIMVMQAFAYLSATELSPIACKVLMLFFAKSGYDNFVGMDVLTIAEEINYTQRSVLKGMKELEDANVIIKTKNVTDRRRNDYFINPLSAWKGNSYARKQMIQVLEKHDPSQLSLFNGKIDEDRQLYSSEDKWKEMFQLPTPL